MNQKERKNRIRENWDKYHTPSMPNWTRIKKNAVFISVANSLEHEKKKLEVCYELKKLGKEFLTEAERNLKKGEPRRRVDIVDLTTGDEIEIEKNKSIKKEGAITIYLEDGTK